MAGGTENRQSRPLVQLEFWVEFLGNIQTRSKDPGYYWDFSHMPNNMLDNLFTHEIKGKKGLEKGWVPGPTL